MSNIPPPWVIEEIENEQRWRERGTDLDSRFRIRRLRVRPTTNRTVRSPSSST